MENKTQDENNIKKDKKEANVCIALGAGVGVAGGASAVVAGVLCPLCVFVAPGLIGYGAYKRWKLSHGKTVG